MNIDLQIATKTVIRGAISFLESIDVSTPWRRNAHVYTQHEEMFAVVAHMVVAHIGDAIISLMTKS